MMNERILKLAKKSGATVNEGFDGTKNFVYGITMSPEELDKFALLLVKECYGEVLCQLYDYNPSSNEQFNLGHETGLKLAVSKIKEHFGVEE